MHKKLREAWRFYESLGFQLVPLALEIDHRGKKKPLEGFPFPQWKTRKFSIEDLKPGHNTIAVITGPESNLFVIDIDMSGGKDGFAYLKSQELVIHGDMPRAKTQANGLHLFFRYPHHLEKQIRTTSSRPQHGIDIRGKAGLIFLPPSVINKGGQYIWIQKVTPDNLTELPQEYETVLLKTFRTRRESVHKPKSSLQKKANPKQPSKKQRSIWEKALKDYKAGYSIGNRSEKDFHLSCVGFQFLIPEYEIQTALVSLPNAKAKDRGQGKRYLRRTLQKAAMEIKHPTKPNGKPSTPAKPDDFAHTSFNDLPENDKGNGWRMAHHCGDDLLYCEKLKNWYIWDGKRFRVDDTLQIMLYAINTVDAIKDAKWRHRSSSRARLESMIKIAKALPKIAIQTNNLDANRHLLNVNNGTIDLRTGKLHPHSRAHRITRLVPVDYTPQARCPLWLKFLSEVLKNDPELIEFVKRAVGYSLTGSTMEQCLFFLYGTGANGKTTFLNVMLDLLGDYGIQVDSSILIASRNEIHPTGVADLFGARLAVTSEVERGKQFAESTIKSLTGEDTITARFMHQNFFRFRPSHKIFLAANHMPTIRGKDPAIWRRIRMIPFTVSIPESSRDPRLLSKLRKELPGILNWAIEGCLNWQAEGLGQPKAANLLKEDYQVEMDILHDFINQICFLHPDAKATSKDLYNAYLKFCDENADTPVKKKSFGMMLKEKGFESWRDMKNRGFVGIRLIEEGEQLLSHDTLHDMFMTRDGAEGSKIEQTQLADISDTYVTSHESMTEHDIYDTTYSLEVNANIYNKIGKNVSGHNIRHNDLDLSFSIENLISECHKLCMEIEDDLNLKIEALETTSNRLYNQLRGLWRTYVFNDRRNAKIKPKEPNIDEFERQARIFVEFAKKKNH